MLVFEYFKIQLPRKPFVEVYGQIYYEKCFLLQGIPGPQGAVGFSGNRGERGAAGGPGVPGNRGSVVSDTFLVT